MAEQAAIANQLSAQERLDAVMALRGDMIVKYGEFEAPLNEIPEKCPYFSTLLPKTVLKTIERQAERHGLEPISETDIRMTHSFLLSARNAYDARFSTVTGALWGRLAITPDGQTTKPAKDAVPTVNLDNDPRPLTKQAYDETRAFDELATPSLNEPEIEQEDHRPIVAKPAVITQHHDKMEITEHQAGSHTISKPRASVMKAASSQKIIQKTKQLPVRPSLPIQKDLPVAKAIANKPNKLTSLPQVTKKAPVAIEQMPKSPITSIPPETTGVLPIAQQTKPAYLHGNSDVTTEAVQASPAEHPPLKEQLVAHAYQTLEVSEAVEVEQTIEQIYTLITEHIKLVQSGASPEDIALVELLIETSAAQIIELLQTAAGIDDRELTQFIIRLRQDVEAIRDNVIAVEGADPMHEKLKQQVEHFKAMLPRLAALQRFLHPGSYAVWSSVEPLEQ